MIGHTNLKHWITFDTVPNHFFTFLPLQNRGFRRCISVSHTVTGRFSQHSAKWLTPTRWWIHNILGAIWQTFGSESMLILKSRFESRITFGFRWDALVYVCALWAQSSFSMFAMTYYGLYIYEIMLSVSFSYVANEAVFAVISMLWWVVNFKWIKFSLSNLRANVENTISKMLDFMWVYTGDGYFW